ncbi:nitrate- and nitrite sensing domain-containing protein [Streptomyces sp. PTM05]|uniref:histidine kinase n=1 Tax=Streptantibioticus parmotrematis TaxID=2873249 RepID=A0ABS7QNN1_9ACTN|nr:nitrate- and nitrite sensing domain-containing protein [Streptantibioticus parmotrematis]MBY8884553.1 nitrate- and nitrite sensing domain-containing protein [Streptantibioticus parmotrematis]
MRLRPRTIRTQLLVLMTVPMVSLAALWAYSSYTTVRGALALTRVGVTYRYYGVPTDRLTLALQDERRAAVQYDASAGGSDHATLVASERTTDARLATLRDHVTRNDCRGGLTAAQRVRVTALLSAMRQLPSLRALVRDHDTDWSAVLGRYSAVIDPEFRLRGALSDLQTGAVARRGTVVLQLARARELLSREDAMVTGALAAGGMTDAQYRDFIGTIDGRKLLYDIYAPELPTVDATRLTAFENGGTGRGLASLEEAARASAAADVDRRLPEGSWRPTVDAALRRLGSIDVSASRYIGGQAHETGTRVLLKAAGLSLAGLLAVVVSLIVSLRISRRIALRLTELRDAAEELSQRRLPDLMRRLREGEPVGVAGPEATCASGGGEAPSPEAVLRFADDEIGQVARAFGIAERAAVRATVEQARLRRGVAAVFTTLARRGQVLLHRQLALLDTMERRTQDADDLADLFRLDHMTNRMRRQAEGLLILSGNTPGRAWNRPARMAEVVGSAAGEVEGHQRIVVRRMPRVALAGGAVADVLHLLAELMENATAFSSPEREVVVEVRPADGDGDGDGDGNGDGNGNGGSAESGDGTVGGGGGGGRARGGDGAVDAGGDGSGGDGSGGGAAFLVTVADRGLGMSAERLAEANAALRGAAARPGDGVVEGADLPESDRLGLFIVGRLAARHGVRVTLRSSRGGGTTAEVLLPGALLLRTEEDVPAGGEGEEVGAPVRRRRMPAGAVMAGAAGAGAVAAGVPRRAVGALRPSAPAVVTTAAGLPRRVPRREAAPDGGGGMARGTVAGAQTDRVAGAHRDRAAGAQTDRAAGVASGGAAGGANGAVPEGEGERSPESARSTVAAYAQGLARGRARSGVTREPVRTLVPRFPGGPRGEAHPDPDQAERVRRTRRVAVEPKAAREASGPVGPEEPEAAVVRNAAKEDGGSR